VAVQSDDDGTDIESSSPWIKSPMSQIPEAKAARRKRDISLVGPMFLWVFIIVIGIAFETVVPSLFSGGGLLHINTAFYTSMGKYILYLPGAIILPLIISVWIGHRVGEGSEDTKTATKLGVLNGVYSSIVYAVVIVIAYIILYYAGPSTIIPLQDFEEYMIGIPVVIVIVFSTLIAVLNRVRK